MSKSYDLVVYGATGFTGSLVCEYLARKAPANLKWAIAGRSASKLKQVIATISGINPTCSDVPVLIADASSPVTLDKMTAASKVVITTVGPYTLYGEPLVKSCIDNGCHYCDLTGEPNFIAASIRKYNQVAQQAQVKIVHCCGFDSVPSDIGAFLLREHFRKQHQLDVDSVELVVMKAKGGFSGGTIASAAEAITKTSKKDEADPYCFLDEGAERVFDIFAQGSDGKKRRADCKIKGDRDPGYMGTAILIAEAGLSLAADSAATPQHFGVQFPATAMGHVIADRLRASGMVLEVRDV